jgi:hypothetical protein
MDRKDSDPWPLACKGCPWVMLNWSSAGPGQGGLTVSDRESQLITTQSGTQRARSGYALRGHALTCEALSRWFSSFHAESRTHVPAMCPASPPGRPSGAPYGPLRPEANIEIEQTGHLKNLVRLGAIARYFLQGSLGPASQIHTVPRRWRPASCHPIRLTRRTRISGIRGVRAVLILNGIMRMLHLLSDHSGKIPPSWVFLSGQVLPLPCRGHLRLRR